MIQILKPVHFSGLRGFSEADLDLSLQAFRRSARQIQAAPGEFARNPRFGGKRADWLACCELADATTNAHDFFKRHFVSLEVDDQPTPSGLFTGYYEPQAEASRIKTGTFTVPIYRKPADLVAFTDAEKQLAGLAYGRRIDGRPTPFYTRREIEEGALQGQGLELAWLRSWEDAFFIHIQGQGRLHMTDGTVMRLAFAAKSGLPYTGIGGILVKRGAFGPEQSSMQAIRRWMAENPGQKRELMWQNQSFVFFNDVAVSDPALGGVGAAKVNLTPRRSLAVDRAFWLFGTPLWLESRLPPEAGGDIFRTLMIAQDTGSAIKGMKRGDVFWGWGEQAAWIAGHMKSPGRLVALLPKSVAARLGFP